MQLKIDFHILTPELMFTRALMDTQANLLQMRCIYIEQINLSTVTPISSLLALCNALYPFFGK